MNPSVTESYLMLETKEHILDTEQETGRAGEGTVQSDHEKLSPRREPSALLPFITWAGWGGKEEWQLQLDYLSHATHQLNSLLLESGDNQIPHESLIHKRFFFLKDSNCHHKCTRVITV